ncbi:MAG: helix-turn-helix transcriptional regulator [Pseudomonadota bacterium]
MGPKQFFKWRKSLGLKQSQAAELLGLKKRMIQYYEKGERDGKAVEVPKYVRLACYAISKNVVDYDGETVKRRR